MVDIATTLGSASRFEVTLAGGRLNPATRTLVGPDMLAALERRVFDLAVCGASAVDPVHGFLGPSEWHAAIGAALTRRARRLAFVADASKFGRTDAHVVRPLVAGDAVASDAPPSPEFMAALAGAGVSLVLPQRPELVLLDAGPQ
jgi:DeoR/GlpR family transcriptional regulator of sugar metabolism